MSFGKKSSTPSAPQPTFTPQPSTPQTITRSANSAEAQDRVSSASDPQASLLKPNPGFAGGGAAGTVEDEEMKRRQYNDSGMF